MTIKVPDFFIEQGLVNINTNNILVCRYKSYKKSEKNIIEISEPAIIFVINGYKIIHFDERDVVISSDNGVFAACDKFVMSEMPEGIYENTVIFIKTEFWFKEAIDLFSCHYANAKNSKKFISFPVDDYLINFLHQLRILSDFINLNNNYSCINDLLTLKIKEILIYLFLKNKEISDFIRNSILGDDKIYFLFCIEKHVYENITLKELAKRCNCSLSTLKEKFHKYLNQSPKKYINERRLEKAAFLLRNTTDTIDSISRKVGFSNVSYFNILFKRKYKMTPSEYRASYRLKAVSY
ncbi:MAG TPA: AraC family transcriptional regulator [Aquifex aeolicus]|uniref:AraC family transcriptional regulator n=1 Tax=Aquifex aeolicus TaxID=63363 RepID=A0A7C5Q288_AQUAO|nr:AraC family transcriptional regulator [Aquifex aeolicus]